jgi:hypothetical protein
MADGNQEQEAVDVFIKGEATSSNGTDGSMKPR